MKHAFLRLTFKGAENNLLLISSSMFHVIHCQKLNYACLDQRLSSDSVGRRNTGGPWKRHWTEPEMRDAQQARLFR